MSKTTNKFSPEVRSRASTEAASKVRTSDRYQSEEGDGKIKRDSSLPGRCP